MALFYRRSQLRLTSSAQPVNIRNNTPDICVI
jgi:hypothetical protein